MILESKFTVGNEQEEILPMDMTLFPFLCRKTDMSWYHDSTIVWHWHNVFELSCIESGRVECLSTERNVILEKGDLLFINTGVLHSFRKLGETSCVYHTLMFDMHFLTGMYNSIFEEKYFLPVVGNSALSILHVRPDSLRHIEMAGEIFRIIELCRVEPEGYEFDIRTGLCNFWRRMLKETEDLRASAPVNAGADSERMKRMIEYIREHYTEPIQLEDIAASAGISTRECTRCFRKCIRTSPNVYLTGCRVRMAARLLSETGKSVLEISEECGFSSSGYFGSVFRKMMGCTPKEYRRKASETPKMSGS